MAEAAAPSPFAGKRVILGVSGGIAAYKACEVASRLAKDQAQVTVVLTQAAQQFVTPITFEALTGRPCLTGMFERLTPGGPPFPHLTPALEADLCILAPATANLVARLAAGMADELLTAMCLVVRCPVVVCPAMNTRMWEHPATQRNVRTLAGLGYHMVGPASGELACGMSGPGRMVEPAEILAAAARMLAEKPAPAARHPAPPGTKRHGRRHQPPRPRGGTQG